MAGINGSEASIYHGVRPPENDRGGSSRTGSVASPAVIPEEFMIPIRQAAFQARKEVELEKARKGKSGVPGLVWRGWYWSMFEALPRLLIMLNRPRGESK